MIFRNRKYCNYNPIPLRDDMGALWENFFISERMKFNHYNHRYVNAYFWRTTQKQEINYVEECDGQFAAFEMKWNPKKGRTTIPSSFEQAYPVAATAIVTPENYLEWLR